MAFPVQQCRVRVKTDELTRQNACLLSGGSYQQFVHVSSPFTAHSHASLLGTFSFFVGLKHFSHFSNSDHFTYVFNGNDIGEIGFTYVVFSYFLTCFNFGIFWSLVFRHYENIYLFEALRELKPLWEFYRWRTWRISRKIIVQGQVPGKWDVWTWTKFEVLWQNGFFSRLKLWFGFVS